MRDRAFFFSVLTVLAALGITGVVLVVRRQTAPPPRVPAESAGDPRSEEREPVRQGWTLNAPRTIEPPRPLPLHPGVESDDTDARDAAPAAIAAAPDAALDPGAPATTKVPPSVAIAPPATQPGAPNGGASAPVPSTPGNREAAAKAAAQSRPVLSQREQIAAYLTAFRALPLSAYEGQKIKDTLDLAIRTKDPSSLDNLIRAADDSRIQLANLTPPPPCQAFHDEHVLLLARLCDAAHAVQEALLHRNRQNGAVAEDRMNLFEQHASTYKAQATPGNGYGECALPE